MAYRIIIKGKEVSTDSVDELDKLLDRYGIKSKGKGVKGQIELSEVSTSGDGQMQSTSLMDKALLKRFIDADRKGIPSSDLQVRLGANKKRVREELERWAKRLSLWQNSFEAIFERGIFAGRKRGYRLTREAIEVSRDLVEMK